MVDFSTSNCMLGVCWPWGWAGTLLPPFYSDFTSLHIWPYTLSQSDISLNGFLLNDNAKYNFELPNPIWLMTKLGFNSSDHDFPWLCFFYKLLKGRKQPAEN